MKNWICIHSKKRVGDDACNLCPIRLSAHFHCAYHDYVQEIEEARREEFLKKMENKANELKGEKE